MRVLKIQFSIGIAAVLAWTALSCASEELGAGSGRLLTVLGEIHLVSAVVKETNPRTFEGGFTSRHVIEHVYSGDGVSVGETFDDISFASQADVPPGSGPPAAAYIVPTLKVGERGIWLLRRVQGRLIRKWYSELGVWWPARQTAPRYEQVMTLAEGIEQLWNSGSEQKRLNMLMDMASSEINEVSVGAIMLLAEGAPEELAHFVSETNFRAIPLRAQLTADEAMIKLEPVEWQTSAERNRLLSMWQERAMENEEDAMLILARFEQAIQRRQIEAKPLWEMLRPIITDKSCSLNVRRRAIGTLRWIVNDPAVNIDLFGLLTSILEDQDDAHLQLTAVHSVSMANSLSSDQLRKLIALRDLYQERLSQATDRHSPLAQIADILNTTVGRLSSPQAQPSSAPQ